MENIKRPIGVLIISIIFFISAFLISILGIMVSFRPATVNHLIPFSDLTQFTSANLIYTSIGLIFVAIIFIIIGILLLKRKNIVRLLLAVFFSFMIISSFFLIFAAKEYSMGIISLLINSLMTYYFGFRKRVIFYFKHDRMDKIKTNDIYDDENFLKYEKNDLY